jgi:hypothetical protein
MKTGVAVFLMAFVLPCITGCNQKHNTELTPEEMDQIRSEVKIAAEPLFTGWAALDGEIAIKSFSTEMVSCFDSLLLDYPAYKESWKIYTGARSGINITTISEDYIILSRDLVIDTWVGRVEEFMKTGEKITFNPIRYTNVFRKSGGEWKIIFAQSTGIPVVEIPGLQN